MPAWRMVSDSFILISDRANTPGVWNDFTIRSYCYIKASLKLGCVVYTKEFDIQTDFILMGFFPPHLLF